MLLTGTEGFMVPGWRGLVLAWFTTVFISQFYCTAFNLLRVGLRHYAAIADMREAELKQQFAPAETSAIKLAA